MHLGEHLFHPISTTSTTGAWYAAVPKTSAPCVPVWSQEASEAGTRWPQPIDASAHPSPFGWIANFNSLKGAPVLTSCRNDLLLGCLYLFYDANEGAGFGRVERVHTTGCLQGFTSGLVRIMRYIRLANTMRHARGTQMQRLPNAQ